MTFWTLKCEITVFFKEKLVPFIVFGLTLPSIMRDLFDMTRHERRGMIVMLIVVALLLVAAVAARYYRDDSVVSADVTEVSNFEAAADTSAIKVVKPRVPKRAPAADKKRAGRPASKPKPKPSREPRRLDPVPAF